MFIEICCFIIVVLFLGSPSIAQQQDSSRVMQTN